MLVEKGRGVRHLRCRIRAASNDEKCPCGLSACFRIYTQTIIPPATIAPTAAKTPTAAPAPTGIREKAGPAADTPPLTFIPLALRAADAALPA